MAIDLSRLPLPAAIEAYSFAQLEAAFMERFLGAWAEERLVYPDLPAFEAQGIAASPANALKRTFSYLRMMDRQRVNEAISALLAPRARGTDLDNVVARQGIERLVVVPATPTAAAILESDAQLLRRYLLSFDRQSAGSAARYLFEAFSAWPGMLDARVNGFAVHGRRGDVDVVIIGPGGQTATEEQRQAVRSAVTKPWVQPEGIAITVLDAVRTEYQARFSLDVPIGPDPGLVRQEVLSRLESAAVARMSVNGEIPPGFLAGAAYGPSVIRARDLSPVAIPPDPYRVPVMVASVVDIEVVE